MNSHDSIALAVSTVIFALRADDSGAATLRIPLVRRITQPFEGRWALPGGAVPSAEGLQAAARRNLAETTALAPSYLEQLYCFGDVDRSPTGRVVSVVYWALVRSDEAEAVTVGENVRWFPADELPELAFDHNLIVDYALWRLRTKMEYSRISAGFLGELFTLAQLRAVHEAVLGRPLDPANFRRQMEPSLIATEERLTGTRHRPPRLYRFAESVAAPDNGPLTAPAVSPKGTRS